MYDSITIEFFILVKLYIVFTLKNIHVNRYN